MAHDHAHDHHGHDHGSDHGHGHDHGPGGHHHHHAAPDDWRYAVGLIANLAFVIIEFTYGVISQSTALIADAAVSLGVVVAGGLMLVTGFDWIDPLVGLVIVAVILWGTWGLLTESLDMALDSAPAGLDVDAVRAALEALPGVTQAHHLHVWSLSTTERALTVHLVRADPAPASFYAEAQAMLKARFNVGHATLQVETTGGDACLDC